MYTTKIVVRIPDTTSKAMSWGLGDLLPLAVAGALKHDGQPVRIL